MLGYPKCLNILKEFPIFGTLEIWKLTPQQDEPKKNKQVKIVYY